MEKLQINNHIRLIKLFAGVGSQAMALRDMGADFESWVTCEWWTQPNASIKQYIVRMTQQIIAPIWTGQR